MVVVWLGSCSTVVFMLQSLSASTFGYHVSSTIITFTSHSKTFDNNKPWELVSSCIFDVSMLFILFYFVSNPMDWLSFIGCFVFLGFVWIGCSCSSFWLIDYISCLVVGCIHFHMKLIRYVAFGMSVLLVSFHYSHFISWFNRVHTTILDGIHCNTLFNDSSTTINRK